MLLTKIKISSKENLISRLSSEMEVEVEIVRCKADEGSGGLSILRIKSRSGADAEDIKRWFSKANGASVVSISSVSPDMHIAMVRNARCGLCQAFVGTDCFLESGRSTGNDSVTWKVYTPNNTALKGMIERIRSEDCKVELLSVKRAASSFELTRIQDEAIRLALTNGYYDIPKRITLEELAARSGISKATLNLILRRGQKKIISDRMRS
jgi:predicted DNA binding protein